MLGTLARCGISIKEGDDKGDSEGGRCPMPLAAVLGAKEGSRVVTKHESNLPCGRF